MQISVMILHKMDILSTRILQNQLQDGFSWAVKDNELILTFSYIWWF